MISTTFIYALFEQDTVKYIGKANNPKERFARHLRTSKSASNKTLWIKGLIEKGEKPTLFIIDEVPFEQWTFWEQHYISLYKSWGFDLVNGDGGGYGSGILCKEAKDKIRLLATGRVPSEETKSKISAAKVGVKLTDEQKKNFGKSRIGKKLSEEVRRNISQAHKGRKLTKEQKKNVGKYWLGKKLSDAHKAKVSPLGRINSQETKNRMRTAALKRWQNSNA